MKKFLLGAAAAAAIAAPGLASAETTGNIDLNYGSTEYDGGGEFDATTLGGAVQFDAMPGWAVALEAQTNSQEWDGSSSNSSHSHAAVHATTNTGAWDFGGFFGLLNSYGNSGWTVGAETRTSFGNFSVEGALGYAKFENFTEVESLSTNLQGAYFFTPNFSVNAGAMFSNIDYTFGDYDVTDLSLGAAYGFGNGFEVYGGYINSEFDANGGGGFESDTWNLGVRYHFNGGTLQETVNEGPSWSTVGNISDMFMRWD